MLSADWIYLKYGTHCRRCRRWLKKGQQALYCASQKTIYCTPCGNMLERAVKRPHELRSWGVKINLN